MFLIRFGTGCVCCRVLYCFVAVCLTFVQRYFVQVVLLFFSIFFLFFFFSFLFSFVFVFVLFFFFSFFFAVVFFFFFFFQAEDGIRDIGVTGVQTCALPILNDLNSHIKLI